MKESVNTTEQITDLERDLYYEQGGSEKVRGVASKLWEYISSAAQGDTHNIPFKMKWIVEKLKQNYKSWKDLSNRERIPLIRQNLRSLLKEVQKKPSQ